MNKLSDKLVEIRMGDPLEKRLKENRRFMQRQKELADILRENWEIPQTKKQRVKKAIRYGTALVAIIILMEKWYTGLAMKMEYGVAWSRKHQEREACFLWKT